MKRSEKRTDEEPSAPRKSYRKPVLSEYGHVEKLSQSGGTTRRDGHGTYRSGGTKHHS